MFNRRMFTIQSLWGKFTATGSVNDRRRHPKRRVTTRRQDRYITVSHLRDRFTSSTGTARQIMGSHGRNIAPQTVRNRLREVGLRCRRPMKGVTLTLRHRQARLRWARQHFRFTRADWANVLFVDETRVKLRGADGRTRIYRRRGERTNANCVLEADAYGGGSVMIWAGISMHTKTPAVSVDGNLTARRYQDQIITPVLLPHFRANRGMMLAQDNAPCHTARATQGMLQLNQVRVIPWPSKSPDLNPIENVWDLLKRRIRKLPQQQNLRGLGIIIQQAWQAIPQRYLQRYIISMRARCRAVIDAQGGHTRY